MDKNLEPFDRFHFCFNEDYLIRANLAFLIKDPDGSSENHQINQ